MEYLHEVAEHNVGIYNGRLVIVVSAAGVGAGIVVIYISVFETLGVGELSDTMFSIRQASSPFPRSATCPHPTQVDSFFQINGSRSVSCILLVDITASRICN